uniref:transketolase n=1 Tax=Cuerna arida TaxID=1464854 RepID=A0A1B6FDT1_9HEMI
MSFHKLDMDNVQQLIDIANKLRIHSIVSTNAANSGHPTSCASIAEIMSTLFFHVMKFDIKNYSDPNNDRFVLSKGHAAPILYAVWAELGYFDKKDLLLLRKFASILEGHPTPRLLLIDVATGSLGQGISNACGMAYVAKYFDNLNSRVYCILGDGESAEGSVWEALNFASHYKLDNLCVIFDINRLGQSEPTSLQHNMDAYKKRVEAFGLHVFVVDGHDVEALLKVFHEALLIKDKPTAVLAKTFKGKGLGEIEDMVQWHGKPLGDKMELAVKNLESQLKHKGKYTVGAGLPELKNFSTISRQTIKLSTPPEYKASDLVSTRFAYGTALMKLAQSCPHVIALDGDTKNSTFSEMIKKADPQRYIECFIAEQNMVGVAIGASCRQRVIPFVSTFGAFFTRAFDQIRMGAISRTNVKFVGSHCGVSIGEDGPSQMGLEDIAMFRTIPNCVIFYPSDAVSCEYAVELAALANGIIYIRTSRPNTPIVYQNNEVFKVGEAKVVFKSDNDQLLIITGGVTLHEVLKMAKELKNSNVHVRVMDLFTIKPIDKDGILSNAKKCNWKVLTVEDHYPEGGIGEAVLSVLAAEKKAVVKTVAVTSLPFSGSPKELLDYYKLSAAHLAETVEHFIR